MKILFLNVWGGETGDALTTFLEKHAVDTDVFCFQEATEKMKADVATVLADYVEVSDYKFISENDDFAQSIYVKKSITITTSKTLFVGDLNVGLAVYVQLEIGDKTVYVCNTHGHARPSEKLDTADRLRFSQYLSDYFKDISAPVVIGGDFNLELETESIGMFQRHGYRDLIKEFSIKTTRNHYAWDRYPGKELYYCDYVFLNEAVTLQTFAVIDNEVSDHLPMIVEIQLT